MAAGCYCPEVLSLQLNTNDIFTENELFLNF